MPFNFSLLGAPDTQPINTFDAGFVTATGGVPSYISAAGNGFTADQAAGNISGVLYNTTPPGTANQTSVVVTQVASAGHNSVMPACRMQPNGTCYAGGWDGQIGEWGIRKFTGTGQYAAFSQPVTVDTPPIPENTPVTLALSVVDSGPDVVVTLRVDGVVVLTHTDLAASTPITTAGVHGLRDGTGNPNTFAISLEGYDGNYVAPASPITISSTPNSFVRGSTATVSISNASADGLSPGAFSVFYDPAGLNQPLTVQSVVDNGSGDYDLTVLAPSNLAIQHDLVGYPIRVTENSTEATSGTIPLNAPVGYSYVYLVGTIVSSPAWVTGNDYGIAYGSGNAVKENDIITNAGESYHVDVAGVLNATPPTHIGGTANTLSGVRLTHLDNLDGSNIAETYANGFIYGRTTPITNSTTTPANGVDGWVEVRESGSAADNFTGLMPIAADQIVYQNPTPEEAITTSVSATAIWGFGTGATVDQTMLVYVIHADGTIGASNTITYTIPVVTRNPSITSINNGQALTGGTPFNIVVVDAGGTPGVARLIRSGTHYPLVINSWADTLVNVTPPLYMPTATDYQLELRLD